MREADRRRACAAAVAAGAALGVGPVDDAVVLSDSNRLVVRLVPCGVVARIATVDYRVFAAAGGAEREVEIVGKLARSGAPVAELDPNIGPRIVVRDGFEISMWTYYEPDLSREVLAPDYASALRHLHDAMRQIDVQRPHFTDRVADTQRWVARRDLVPDIAPEDRRLLIDRLESSTRSILDRGAAEQLLHGEPHPWNVLNTRTGPRFIDFENCVRGPVAFDLGWVPSDVTARYPDADPDLVAECRGLVLAMIAAHRWRPDDQHPGRSESATTFLNLVRAGPPWPSLDAVK